MLVLLTILWGWDMLVLTILLIVRYVSVSLNSLDNLLKLDQQWLWLPSVYCDNWNIMYCKCTAMYVPCWVIGLYCTTVVLYCTVLLSHYITILYCTVLYSLYSLYSRKDGLVLHHWRRSQDEGKDYPFARFNKVMYCTILDSFARLNKVMYSTV